MLLAHFCLPAWGILSPGLPVSLWFPLVLHLLSILVIPSFLVFCRPSDLPHFFFSSPGADYFDPLLLSPYVFSFAVSSLVLSLFFLTFPLFSVAYKNSSLVSLVVLPSQSLEGDCLPFSAPSRMTVVWSGWLAAFFWDIHENSSHIFCFSFPWYMNRWISGSTLAWLLSRVQLLWVFSPCGANSIPTTVICIHMTSCHPDVPGSKTWM